MSANVRHSSGSPQWGTPRPLIEIAQRVLHPFRESDEAAIDVDPFSEPEFNAHVGAARILTGEKGRDGFVDRWVNLPEWPRADHLLAGIHTANATQLIEGEFTAIVNPPGDDSGDNVKNAWRLVDTLHGRRWLDSVLWVGFSLNSLQTLQGISTRNPLSVEFLRCIPARRMGYIRHSSNGKADDAPSHPSYCVLLPSHDVSTSAEQRRLFESMGGSLGEVF